MAEKILIIDDDLDTLRLVGLMLQKQGYQIAAANNGKQGLAKVEEEIPDLILLDVMMPDMDGYEVARRLRQNAATAKIPILMFTAKSQLDDKVTGFESGADDYLTKPTHPTELQAHVKALLARSVKSEKTDEEEAPSSQNAFTVGVISARGGLGVSSISLNLGSYLNTGIGEETIIVELASGLGTIGRDLGFEDLSGLSTLLRGSPEEITSEKVEEILFEHESGLRVLPASEEPRDAELGSALSQTRAIFKELLPLSKYLVIDFGAGLSALDQALLPQCDLVIVVVEAFANSIEHSKLLLANLFELGLEKEQVLVALNNRVRSEMLLSMGQVKEKIDYPVTTTFTPAPELYVQAVRQNRTCVLHEPESMLTQQFKKMATVILEYEAKEE
ncbi:MAG: response regulator [Chloroflexi bacterium]|nr:response regulator [Chloroflexota bacterium]